jgi:hypothetical protein
MEPQPYIEPSNLIQSVRHARADMERLRDQLAHQKQTAARLLFLLEEELIANGNTFASMETDILFKRWFWGESTTKHSEVFDRLRATYRQTATH